MSAFHFILPPVWNRIDLTGDVSVAYDAAITPFVRAAPVSRQPSIRRLLTDQMASVVALSDGGAVCAVMALNPFDRCPIRPVMAFRPVDARLWAASPGPIDTRAVLVALAEQEVDAEVVLIDDLVGIRTTATADPTERYLAYLEQHRDDVIDMSATADDRGPGDDLPVMDTVDLTDTAAADALRMQTSRVHYLLAHPEDTSRWISIAFSADTIDTPTGQDLTLALIGLFDAMVSTFRWAA